MKSNHASAYRSQRLLQSLLLFLLGTAFALSLPASGAVTWQNVQFGGYVSQGYLLSSANDYLGNTSDGTFDFREYAANASYAKGKWRIGAQIFGQKLGDYGDDEIKLDWATIDYQPAQWLGFRAGRVKLPRGLYNEALDLDSVRPFVLLPQSIYDARLRDFNAAFNGAMVFGNVSLKRFGSADYRIYYGDTPMSIESGASDFFNTDAPFQNTYIGITALVGGTLFWNTPVNGLRVGYSDTTFKNLNIGRRVVVPGRFAYDGFKNAEKYYHHQFSAEYILGDWTFATEAARENTRYMIGTQGVDTNATAPFHIDYKADLFYVSAARRINSWLELGTYCSVSRDHYSTNITAVKLPPLLKQTDYALSARFDLSEHLLFKLEGHYMDGAGKVFNTPSHPVSLSSLDTSWTMLAAKVTYSF